MTDFIFQVGLSNSCFAIVLALLALLVGANAKRAQLAHVLWLLVLVKLVTPPLVNLPTAILSPSTSSVDLPLDDGLADGELSGIRDTSLPNSMASVTGPNVLADTPTSWSMRKSMVVEMARAKPWLIAIWLSGSLLLVSWSLLRVYRFNVLLQMNQKMAPKGVLDAARSIMDRLNSNAIPDICTTSARIAPMVWWVGGRVRVVLPEKMLLELQPEQWRLVLAHELAHVHRRDYLVRWLEWLACVCFWWNPVVWWAQRNLRATEEICCDGLVLSGLNPGSRLYAESILTAVESLITPAIRPPAVASEINSGGFLERRIEMILSGNSRQECSRLLQYGVVAVAMLLIPFGLIHAQEFEAVGKRLAKSVKKGEITIEQAAAMMSVLKKEASDENRISVKWSKGNRGKTETEAEAEAIRMGTGFLYWDKEAAGADGGGGEAAQEEFELELVPKVLALRSRLRGPTITRYLITLAEKQQDKKEANLERESADYYALREKQSTEKKDNEATWWRRGIAIPVREHQLRAEEQKQLLEKQRQLELQYRKALEDLLKDQARKYTELQKTVVDREKDANSQDAQKKAIQKRRRDYERKKVEEKKDATLRIWDEGGLELELKDVEPEILDPKPAGRGR